MWKDGLVVNVSDQINIHILLVPCILQYICCTKRCMKQIQAPDFYRASQGLVVLKIYLNKNASLIAFILLLEELKYNSCSPCGF